MLNSKQITPYAFLLSLFLIAACRDKVSTNENLVLACFKHSSKNLKYKTYEEYDFNDFLYTEYITSGKLITYLEKEKEIKHRTNKLCSLIDSISVDNYERIHLHINEFIQFASAFRNKKHEYDTIQFSDKIKILNIGKSQIRQNVSVNKEMFIVDFQTRIRGFEYFILNYITRNLTIEYWCQSPKPIIVTNSLILKPNDTLVARIYPAYFDTAFVPDISLNNRSLNYEKGKAIYVKKNANRKGKIVEKGYSTLYDPSTGEKIEFPFQIKYEVK